MSAITSSGVIPKPFVWRRLHSLMGLWFLIFLMEHLFTNSQAALFFRAHAMWFVSSVDFLRNIPYLQAVEVTLLGIPIVYHSVLGFYYMFSAKSNSRRSDGTKPIMKYGRSHAYTWQRISAWILFVGIILHVVQMRVLDYPYKYGFGKGAKFYTTLNIDPGLYLVADQLDVKLYDQEAIDKDKDNYQKICHKIALVEAREKEMRLEPFSESYSSEMDKLYQSVDGYELMKEHILGLESRPLKVGKVMAVSKSFGSLELLNVRETFQSPLMMVLYTIFVLAAVFHGFNGLWTFMITWGLILSRGAQSTAKNFCIGLMFVMLVLGMMSIWGVS